LRTLFQNQLLISFQNPEATLVAGFHKWKTLGRSVKKGQKGIAIFAPCAYRTKVEDDNGNEKTFQQLRGFRVVYVFDILQTDGDPIEDLDAIRPKLLDGDAPEGIWEVLVAQTNAAGFEVVRDQKRNENGYCDFVGKKIAVRPDVAPAQALKTLVHELGHALLHGDGPVASREVAEVEVESVAYIVCDALGLDTSSYSFKYVATWSDGDVEKIKVTGERVIHCSKRILVALEASDAEVAARRTLGSGDMDRGDVADALLLAT
jgi:antirestriction protein ArdC